MGCKCNSNRNKPKPKRVQKLSTRRMIRKNDATINSLSLNHGSKTVAQRRREAILRRKGKI